MAISIKFLVKRAIKKELKKAIKVSLPNKTIIISDVHLVAHISRYHKCINTLIRELERYKKEGYKLVILGDFFDIWIASEKNIINAEHNQKLLKLIYSMLKVLITGNHDRIKYKLLKKYCSDNLIIAKSIKCNNTLMTHGNVGELTEYVAWLNSISIYAVRALSWLHRKGLFKELPRAANDVSKKHCYNLQAAQQSLSINLICGHTHNPRIKYKECQNGHSIDHYYANTGCVSYLNGSIDILEYCSNQKNFNNTPSLQRFKYY